MNISEIVTAWITSFNPTTEQKSRASERAEICFGCDRLKNTNLFTNKVQVCGACGCPINKKVFSQEYNPCPLKKWEEVDKKYVPKEKNKKTLL
jgi:hypothetical protein